MNQTAIARFRSKVLIGDDGHWHWTGSLRKNGYGQFRLSTEKNGYAHRAAYKLYVGPIPEGMTVDHTCELKSCVNPDHLQLLSWEDNHRKWAESVTHCQRGHEFTPENTIITSQGRRACKTCWRANQKKWQENNIEHYRAYHREYQRKYRKKTSS